LKFIEDYSGFEGDDIIELFSRIDSAGIKDLSAMPYFYRLLYESAFFPAATNALESYKNMRLSISGEEA
jgi:hypothetical protein